MRSWRGAVSLLVVFGAGSAYATLEPFWMFADSVNLIYSTFRFCDTARDWDWACDTAIDTGDSYDGSPYINLDYQFSSDSLIVKDPFDTTFIMYRDLRPGYAGFKTAWDYGMTGYPVARYKYLVFTHKGPLPAHRVTVRSWYNDGGCGSPSYNELIGTFETSSTWTEDTIVIPDSVRNKIDRERNFNKYYEMVFIINNLDPGDTTSGPPGCLKIDNIRLVGCNPINSSPKPQDVNTGGSATFTVSTTRADPGDVLTFQWKKDGADIAGANDSVYTIPSATAADAGEYTVAVTVSSTNLTFTSLGAALTVSGGTAPVITTQPADLSVVDGASVTFNVAASGNPAPTFQWERSNDGGTTWNPVGGATDVSLTFAAVLADNGAEFRAVATNSQGSATSNAATLTVAADAGEVPRCGCGSGTGMALIPPLFFKAMVYRRRKKTQTGAKA